MRIFCLFIFSFLFAEAPGHGLQKLKVYTTEYPPYQTLENGKVTGISADKVRKLFAAAKIEADISIVPWARADHDLAQNTESIFFFSLSRTSEREKQYRWIADITPAEIKIWKLARNTKIQISSIEDLKKYKQGTLKGVVSHQFLLNKGIPPEKFYFVSRDEQLVSMLSAERVDLIAIDEVAFLYQVKKLQLSPQDFAIAYSLPEISGTSYLVSNLITPNDLVLKLQKTWKSLKR